MTATPLTDLGKSARTEKGWWKAHQWLILRRFSQGGIIGLFLLGPLAGLWIVKGNLANSLVLDTVPLLDPIVFAQMAATGLTGLTTTVLLGVGLVVAFYAVVGGRVFCSWACPMNIVTDIARWGRRKLDLKGGTKLPPQTRYFMLAAAMLTAAGTGSLAYELINPVSVLHRGLIFGMGFGWTLILAVFLFDLLVMKDGWCGHLCPMGALYGLIGQFSLIRVRADSRERCNDCAECYEVCPEMHVIPPALKGAKGEGPVILSADCTNCGACIDVCGKSVFRFGLRAPNPSRDSARQQKSALRQERGLMEKAA